MVGYNTYPGRAAFESKFYIYKYTYEAVSHGQLVRVQGKEGQTSFIETLTATILKDLPSHAMNCVKITMKGLGRNKV
jgi:hypothetical protein